MDLYEAVETICNDYCKYPDIESGNKLADICDKCPMNKCEDLRWADYKDKPTTQTETQNSNLTFEKRTMRDCYNCKRYETEGECVECHYEPKDEPQDEYAKEYEELGLRKLKELRKDEPQTEREGE